jgi:hypothetical protein
MYLNTTANYTTALGAFSLYQNTTGSGNTATGYSALGSNTTGSFNTASGYNALYRNTASYNSAFGYEALTNNTAGVYSTAVGYHSQYTTSTGSQNVSIGAFSLNSMSGPSGNTGMGHSSLYNLSSGSNNTGMGNFTLLNVTTASNNSALGYFAGVNSNAITNSTAIGYFANATASNQVWLGNSSVTAVWTYGGYFSASDARFKRNVKEDVPGLEFIKQLRPVSYNYDINGLNAKTGVNEAKEKAMALAKENGGAVQEDESASKATAAAIAAKEKKKYSGFLAQEVDAAAKKMNYDFSGVYKPQNDKDLYGLNYSEFVVPLVKAVQELSNKNDELQARIDKLEALLKTSTGNSVKITNASLDQNVPNPVKNSTVIAYTLPPKFTSASIVISDAAGKRLKTVTVNGLGRGTVNVDVSALASGNYQYSLYSDGQIIDTKKLVIAR